MSVRSDRSTDEKSKSPPVWVKKSTNTSPVHNTLCKFFNPYFGSGCNLAKHGECPFRHLTQSEFARYLAQSEQCMNKMSKRDLKKFKAAQKQFDQHQYHKCQQVFGYLMKKYMFNKQVTIMLARLHEKRHSLDIADYYYRRAISVDPSNATFHGRYACFCYHKLKRYALAKQHFVRSLALKQSLSMVHREYGHYLQHREQRLVLAQQHYKKCLALFHQDDECHFFYAQLLHKLGDYKLARLHIEIAIRYHYSRTHRYYFEHHLFFGLLLHEIHADAHILEEQWQICLDLNKKHPVPWMLYGVLLCQKSEVELGLKYMEKSLDMKYCKENQRVYQQMKAEYHQTVIVAQPPRIEVDEKKCDGFMDDEKRELAQTLRTSEFERFMEGVFSTMKHKMNVKQYLMQFREQRLNDIRLLFQYDAKCNVYLQSVSNLVLKEKLKRRMDEFRVEMHEFREWLRALRMDAYIAVFEKYGILTMQQFERHINSVEDLKWLIGEQHGFDSATIWNSPYPSTNKPE
eukprot:CAMPEP_0197035066 /NCGR_PEP_ID=MMETSP1384-20130603/12956_1 /TAXON_ID=29189 /ORGANISM="Ammonia sp." /LENGTH=514 /DNA_ID=CAMNT_0042465073 /DNA_START=38 /DNA_END=1582 /DNA_ORIENTATION=+